MPQFTTETAADMAKRSWEARRAAQSNPAPEPQPAEQSQAPDASGVRAKLDKLSELMDEAEDDRQWDAYSRAYERMFRVWCTLTKTPGPGNLKPTSPRQPRQSHPEPTPIPPVSS